MEQSLLTRGEMERKLSQYVQAFYRNQLGCRTNKISSHLLNKQLAIAVENSITPIERLLDNSYDDDFVRHLRNRIDIIIKNELLSNLGNILGVEVIDLTINTTLDNNYTGVVAWLAETPKVRNNKQINKVKTKQSVGIKD